MRVGIVHDESADPDGRILASLRRLYPSATVHPLRAGVRSLLPARRDAFGPRTGRAVVLSTGSALRARAARDACHVAYAYAPPRSLWEGRRDAVWPFRGLPLAPVVREIRRSADRRAVRAPHFFVTVSAAAAERLARVHGIQATVVPPPVRVEAFHIAPTTGDYHLVVGPLVAGRNVELAVKAFSATGRRLVVVGSGPARAALEQAAATCVEFRGDVEDATLVALYSRCRGVVIPGEEEFPFAAVEALASGRPAIAFRAGGAAEVVEEGVTGVLFEPAAAGALSIAVERAQRTVFDPALLRGHAEEFREPTFHSRLRTLVERSVSTCLRCARQRRTGTIRHRSRSPHRQQAAAR